MKANIRSRTWWDAIYYDGTSPLEDLIDDTDIFPIDDPEEEWSFCVSPSEFAKALGISLKKLNRLFREE
ncbi:MAG TPA: hypothetical protein PKO06_16935 [Candidatus Ozemobacteraceae bacterium]|nr:hypothetical protein [Candidatus Ozemobacteraceae bacterium]